MCDSALRKEGLAGSGNTTIGTPLKIAKTRDKRNYVKTTQLLTSILLLNEYFSSTGLRLYPRMM